MFGTNPLCDVQLNDPSVSSFHGRIRWSRTNFKVEAVNDASFVEVNGTKVKSKGLHQGDEVRAGHTRIFLLSVEDDGPDHGEKTVVLDPHTARVAGIDLDAPGKSAFMAPPPPASAPPPQYHKMDMAPPSLEFLAEGLDDDDEDDDIVTLTPAREHAPVPLPRQGHPSIRRTALRDFDEVNEEDEPEPSSTRSARRDNSDGDLPRTWQARLHRWVALLRGTEAPPDDDRVFTSPVVIGLAVTFVVLVGLSFGLYRFIAASEARRHFAAATEEYELGEFIRAIKDYDAYLKAEPTGSKANKARVYQALAKVRQHTSTTSGSWNNAFKEAEAMVADVGTLPEYRDVSVDLAEEVRKTAEGMLERARDLADNGWLNQAQAAIALHKVIAGSPADSLLARSKVPARLIEAQDAIRKATDLKAAIVAIDAAIGSNHPGEAYHVRSGLVKRYPDLVANKDIRARLGKINDLIRSAVRFDPSGRPGVTEPLPEPLGPPTSLVYRLDPGRVADRSGPVAVALADGWAWGFDSATGAPLWQVPVGQAAPFTPVRVEGGGNSAPLLMVDARSNELVSREARSGRLIWRQTLEGWATDPPLILGSRVLQPLIDGRILEIDLRTGDLKGTLRLGRRIAHSLVLNEAGDQAYLLGHEDCLFVLTLDPLGCTAVEFLGHEAGTVGCSPTRAGRLLIVPENQTLDAGRWRVFLLGATGTGLQQVQEVPIGGWTWASPVASGSVVWSASDRGEIIAFSIGRLDAKNPLAPIGRIPPGPKTQGPAFPIARSEREFTVASGLSAQYELDTDRGKLTPIWTLGASGHALAPPQPIGRTTVLTSQAESGGGTALWGVDSASGSVQWRTVVGSPWPSRWLEAQGGDAISTLLGDGHELALNRDNLRAGGFIEQPLGRTGGAADIVKPGSVRLEVEGTSILVPDPDASQVMVRESSGSFRPVPLPARLAAPPLLLGRNLLVPGALGRVYLVDPRTGLSAADPYVPPFDRSKPTRWLLPVGLAGDAAVVADTEGILRRLVVEAEPRPRLTVAAERKLDSPPLGDPAATEQAVLIVTADLKIRSFAGRDLSPLGSWPLATPPTLGPVVVGGFGFVVDASGQVFAFDGDGRRLWTATLREPRVTGPPVVRNHAAWFVTRDGGSVEALALSDGASTHRTQIDIEPAGGLFAAETDLILPTGSSTWQTFTPNAGAVPR